MGFSVTLAPRVRVRASSSGVRTMRGPPVARVHVGGGRTSVSTGTVNRQLAGVARQQPLADEAAEARRLQQVFDAISALHQADFPPAQRRIAPPPPEPPLRELRDLYRGRARRETSVFEPAARRQALATADSRAEAGAATARVELARQSAEIQARLDADWGALLACEPDTVLHALDEAFADNQAAAAAVGIDQTEVSLLVVVPPVSDLPERAPTVTPAGNLSLKKLTRTETAGIYKQFVCGQVVATLRMTFAVAPGVQSARIVAIRARSPDAYGKVRPEVVAAARCSRDALIEVRWQRVDAVQVVNDCCTEKILIQKGATRALQPIPLDGEPELRALLAVVDMSELD